jgi:PAS domain S-box-containing protein
MDVLKDDAYAVLFESHPLPMWIVDVGTYRFLAVNNAAVLHYGYSREEFLSMSLLDIRPQEDVPQFEEQLSKLALTPGPQVAVNRRHVKKDGTIIFVEVCYSRITHGDGQALLTVVFDVTERTRYEERLLHSAKMEALGRLAGGVAHDFNNLLTIILGYSNIALDSLSQSDPLRPNIDGIRKAADRAAALTRQMLTFSRRQVLQPKLLNLNEILADTSKMLRRLINEDIELSIVADYELHAIMADPVQIEQILINLTVNARDAMPSGGTIGFETRNVDPNEWDAVHSAHPPPADLKPGRYVLLGVKDDGRGMDEKTKSHIFEPFFTTKIPEGTGLGLPMVYGIVKQSGGDICVYSEPGRGTTFEIYFPVATMPGPHDEAVPAETFRLKGSETVLLVEDETELRTLARNILSSYGYKVLEAVNGEDALKIAAAHSGRIDLMITDVVMPKLGGRDLARKLVAMRPETKVIFMSGYDSDAVARHGVLEPGTDYLEKPFSVEILMRKVREILSRK